MWQVDARKNEDSKVKVTMRVGLIFDFLTNKPKLSSKFSKVCLDVECEPLASSVCGGILVFWRFFFVLLLNPKRLAHSGQYSRDSTCSAQKWQ